MSRHRRTNGFCAHTHTQAHACVCTHTHANTHAHIWAHTLSCYPFLPLRPASLEVGNGYSFFWACETNTKEKSAHTHTFSPISCANVCTLPLKERKGDGAVREAAWERRLAGQDGGGAAYLRDSEMHLSPSNPRAASSAVPRCHLHVPAPPRLRVFKRPWFGQLLKHKKVLERRVRVGGPKPEGPRGLVSRCHHPERSWQAARHLGSRAKRKSSDTLSFGDCTPASLGLLYGACAEEEVKAEDTFCAF